MSKQFNESKQNIQMNHQQSLLSQTVDLLINSRYPEMDRNTRKEFEALLRPQTVRKGEVFMNEGEYSKDLFVVGQGMIRQYYYKKGKDITEHFSYEGCLFLSIKSTLWGEPNHLFAEALEDTILYRTSLAGFQEATKQHWGLNIFYRKVLEYSLVVSQEKAYEWRFNTAKEKYEILLKNHPEVVKRAPLFHIASYLNMTPETLSRVRSSLL